MRISDWSSDVCSSDLYCGQLGKQDNCQIAVTLSVANHAASLPVAHRLYLPEDWTADPIRRDKASVPHALGFAPKPALALGQHHPGVEAHIPPGVVPLEAGNGADNQPRTRSNTLSDFAYAIT